MILTAVAAGLFGILGLGAQGYVWAGAVSAAIVAACVVAVVHALLFTLVWLVSPVLARRDAARQASSSPFASEAFPLVGPSLVERMEAAVRPPPEATNGADRLDGEPPPDRDRA
ncbi:MAG: hypothetical protein KDA63_06590 [Planctomycetales bacterium]|nr:hypothetical protein [Planctomycetales bacterium]